jgi:hypothetical protein
LMLLDSTFWNWQHPHNGEPQQFGTDAMSSRSLIFDRQTTANVLGLMQCQCQG